ncbi:hypothetical protein CGLO_18439 [Colletotrichum gloeosporioides Cg-14]|uniref:Uncharacterized protein n=1 Tax=Colletotrichum gloeosporioides (strain Cg-14) TaxID=1237896 RepID=T0L4B3_COLGC|nr:hypothetical protein CGLO_18439 [Colletotrichum gloeosporioides Cg-14]
MLFYYYYST